MFYVRKGIIYSFLGKIFIKESDYYYFGKFILFKRFLFQFFPIHCALE